MKSIEHHIAELSQDFSSSLNTATTLDTLEQIRITFLGRQGKISDLMAVLKELSVEEKRIFGPKLNTLKQTITEQLEKRTQEFVAEQERNALNKLKNFDVTAYKKTVYGSLHPHTMQSPSCRIFLCLWVLK